jgi:N-methylhydantoinase A/oxoprolinase/acetone carboxylase beta subunit
MYLGIDVGGTHTDAVVMDGRTIAASAKVPTDHHDLLASVRAAMQGLLRVVEPGRITRMNLSTTLSTNAIVEGKTEDVAVVVSAGPGIDPEHFRVGRFYFPVGGSIDHRGEEIAPLDPAEMGRVATACCDAGVRLFAAVGKFSTRNPAHETAMGEALGARGGGSPARCGCGDFVSLGHRLSGQLNFPRRVATAYYNSAVWRVYNRFADAIEQSAREFGITAPIHILKADGGTMPLAVSRELPVESILSGPAASVMGIIALCKISEDCVILDIGGTTTDIAVFACGSPVIEKDGIEVGSYPTLVRALKTRSIGVGGDSRLHVAAGAVRVGPERAGASMAMGGRRPTLIDALNFRGHAAVGDVAASVRGIREMAGLWDLYPERLADDAIAEAVARIRAAVADLVDEVNARPVYTIMELLQGRVVEPSAVYLMGGPAKVMQPLLAPALGKRVEVPDDFAVANAIGAALTRTTAELELFADTEKGVLFIPTLGVERKTERGYDLERARADARDALLEHLAGLGVTGGEAAVEVVEASSFNMVGDYGTVGRNIRVKCQVRPGIMGDDGGRNVCGCKPCPDGGDGA